MCKRPHAERTGGPEAPTPASPAAPIHRSPGRASPARPAPAETAPPPTGTRRQNGPARRPRSRKPPGRRVRADRPRTGRCGHHRRPRPRSRPARRGRAPPRPRAAPPRRWMRRSRRLAPAAPRARAPPPAWRRIAPLLRPANPREAAPRPRLARGCAPRIRARSSAAQLPRHRSCRHSHILSGRVTVPGNVPGAGGHRDLQALRHGVRTSDRPAPSRSGHRCAGHAPQRGAILAALSSLGTRWFRTSRGTRGVHRPDHRALRSSCGARRAHQERPDYPRDAGEGDTLAAHGSPSVAAVYRPLVLTVTHARQRIRARAGPEPGDGSVPIVGSPRRQGDGGADSGAAGSAHKHISRVRIRLSSIFRCETVVRDLRDPTTSLFHECRRPAGERHRMSCPAVQRPRRHQDRARLHDGGQPAAAATLPVPTVDFGIDPRHCRDMTPANIVR